MENKKPKVEFYGGKFVALLPVAMFIVFAFLFFVVWKTYGMIELCMGGFVAILVSSIFAKNKAEYWDSVATGMASKVMNELALILFIVGMFGKMMTRGGVAEGFVWLGGQMGLSGGMFTAFTFIATCIIATATGTSIGTLFTAFPILYPSGLLLGAHPVFLAGAILSGAIFGDNVGPVSDTTIVSASTQTYKNKDGHADIGGVVMSRAKYALAGAAIALVLFFIFGGTGSVTSAAEADAIMAQYGDPSGLIMLIPVVVLLVIAFKSRNIYVAAFWGIVSGTVVGLVSGILTPADILSVEGGAPAGFLMDGINNMIGTVGYSYAVAGLAGILRACGLLDALVDALTNSKLNKTAAGTETIIGIGIIACSAIFASANGPAIMMWGPLADDLGSKAGLHPYRRANLLDGFASTIPVIIPVTSSFIFICMSCVSGLTADYAFVQEISPVALAGAALHCWCLLAVLIFSVITGWGRAYEGANGELVRAKEKAAK